MCNSLSGAIELISEDLCKVIREQEYKTFDPFDLEFTQDLLDSYLEKGILTEFSLDEEIEEVRQTAKMFTRFNDTYSIVIIPNMNCNYRCTYCFELKSPYFKTRENAFLSQAQLEGIFRFIENNPVSDTITLFGGEPLNRENYRLIESIIERVKGRFSINAVTNGHDLDAFIPLLGEGKISRLQITIDGPKHIHDKRRISLDRESSYDHIFSNIPLVLNVPGVNIDIRINVDNRNVKHLGELLKEIQNKGLAESDSIVVYASMVTGLDSSVLDEEMLGNELVKWHKQYPFFVAYADEISISDDLITALMFSLPLRRGSTACGGVGNMLVFAPDDHVYSCWDYVGLCNNAHGTYDSNGIINWNLEQKSIWEKGKLEYREYCLRCPYALLCKGGCYNLAQNTEKIVSTRRCYLYNKRFPSLLADVVEKYIHSIETLNRSPEDEKTSI